ncbi:GDSL esterase/lipase At5g03610-like isoform X2 [Prosopis cineraria]|uniref:GDSL esterase/lipase At5g03610-like isoform X2 n=1 Tax=Prosopis cineraria TaxID=364024 RepID=UPI00240FBD10|nr:GDSL esterase/lipase At5g03610-like isoform X2 [Prosopis cineraria]
MAKQTHDLSLLSLLVFLNLFAIFTVIEGSSVKKKLFVFGDSYVDTGNFLNSPAFKPPYGDTFPGAPAGRFCDGRVLSDYIASLVKIESPVAYEQRKSANQSVIENGMNFAHGGTGVFQTMVDGPNVTTQIDKFQQLLQQNVFTKQDLQSSIALLNAASNDFSTFLLKNGSTSDLPAFAESLVNQISVDLERIHRLGVNKIAVGLVAPLGCLPLLSVSSSHQNCSDEANKLANYHNNLLLKKVKDLNNNSQSSSGDPVFITLDLYNAFLNTITTLQKQHAENPRMMNPLEPCCVGVNGGECGSVDKKGEKQYKVCEKAEESIFWDNVHPSQNGWLAVSTALQSSFQQQLSI